MTKEQKLIEELTIEHNKLKSLHCLSENEFMDFELTIKYLHGNKIDLTEDYISNNYDLLYAVMFDFETICSDYMVN